jgi:hypothetical protein
MLARYLNAPLLLLLWQVAPLDFHRDHAGRVRLSFGAGRGDFAFRDDPGYPAGTSCAGSYPARAPYTDKLGYSSRALAAEVWASQRVRIHAAIGGVTDYSGERHGSFAAFQAALEQKHYGFGLGFAAFGGPNHSLQPSASARLGSLDGLSLRADYRQPQSAMGLIGGPRIGLGWNQGQSRKPRVLFGLATTAIPDTARRVGGFVELAVPLGFLRSGLSVNGFMSGRYHGNEVRQIYSLGLGACIQP